MSREYGGGEAVELIDVFERLAVEGAGDRVCRVFDVDGGLLRRLAVRGAGRAENLAELGPLRRRDAGAVIADHAAAPGHERDERGAHLRRVEDVADGVVQIHRVVLLQVCRGDGARFARQRCREGPGFLTHQLHREIGVRNRGVAAVRLAVVNPLPIEDEEFPGLPRSGRRLRGQGGLDFRAFLGRDFAPPAWLLRLARRRRRLRLGGRRWRLRRSCALVWTCSREDHRSSGCESKHGDSHIV